MSVFCSQCGVAVADDSKFCFKCGGTIHKGVPAAVETPHKPVVDRFPSTQVSVPADAPSMGERVRTIVDCKIAMSKWWPTFAAFAFFLCLAIVQSKRQHASSPLSEKLILVFFATLIYTTIAAFYFSRSKKVTPLMPWEAEARRIKANWYLFVAVSLSCGLSLLYTLTGSSDTGTIATVVILALVFGAGFAGWKGNLWAVVALFVWELFSVLVGGGAMEPLGLFVVIFCVQAFRYQYAAKKFEALNRPDILGPLTGLTRLAFAATQSHLHYAKHLVKSGADINEKTETGLTPLILAAATNEKPDVVKWLLKAGADKTVQAPDGRRAADFARDRGASIIAALLA